MQPGTYTATVTVTDPATAEPAPPRSRSSSTTRRGTWRRPWRRRPTRPPGRPPLRGAASPRPERDRTATAHVRVGLRRRRDRRSAAERRATPTSERGTYTATVTVDRRARRDRPPTRCRSGDRRRQPAPTADLRRRRRSRPRARSTMPSYRDACSDLERRSALQPTGSTSARARPIEGRRIGAGIAPDGAPARQRGAPASTRRDACGDMRTARTALTGDRRLRSADHAAAPGGPHRVAVADGPRVGAPRERRPLRLPSDERMRGHGARATTT